MAKEDIVDDASDRAGQLHKKGLISDDMLAKTRAKAKKAKAATPKKSNDADTEIEGSGGGGDAGGDAKITGAPKVAVAAANDKDDKKDDGDHEYR